MRLLSTWPLLLLALLGAVIIAGSWLLVKGQLAESRRVAVETLNHITQMKAEQIALWMKERHSDATAIRDVPQAVRYLRSPVDTQALHNVQAWMSGIQQRHGYSAVILLDAAGKLCQSVPDAYCRNASLVEHGREIGQQGLIAREVVLIDLHRSPDASVQFAFVAPVGMRSPAGEPAAGMLIVIIDPRRFLYPLIQAWPTPSTSAEALLIRREGDEVIFLNDLRHRADAPLTLRLPITANHRTPAAMAARGVEGVVEGEDYRGAPVLAAVRGVANSPWFMVAKVDRDEVYAAGNKQAWNFILLAVLLMSLASLGVALIWRQQQLARSREALVALGERERWLRKVLDVENVGVMFWDVTSGTLTDANETFLRIMGYSRQDVEARQLTWQALTPPEYIGVSVREMESFRANGRLGPYEKEYLRKDGSRQWFVFAGSALGENDCVEFCIDISRMKRAEAALAESEERLRLALQAANQGLYDLNVQSGEATVSAEYATMLGYDPETFVETNAAWIERLHPDDRGVTARAYADYVDGKSDEYRVEFRQKTRNGDWKWILSLGKTVQFDSAGKPLRMLGTHTDITERKQAEAEAAQHARELELGRQALLSVLQDQRQAEASLRKLALAVEQSPESIVITNLASEIEYVNEAFLTTTGYEREQLIGQNPNVLQSGKTPRSAYDAMWAALTAGNPWKGEFINRKASGEEYVEFVHIAPLRQPDGRISHYVAVKEDISEKKRLSVELDQHRLHLEDLVAQRTAELRAARHEAETASKAKSAFLANMSHELRTPMNAIIGMTELALRRASDSKLIDQLGKIKGASGHLLQVINDILDISKIEADRLQLDNVDLTLADILNDVVGLIRPKAAENGLRLQVRLAQGLPERTFSGDATRLRQIIFNLTGNALKFTEKGSITIRAEVVEETLDKVLLRWEIADTGIGIDAEVQARLFEVFEQADTSITRKFGGTGLGLAICKRLVHMMDGDIGVMSTLGQGSTFWFTVRLGKALDAAVQHFPTASADTPESSLRKEFSGTRLLLAEDESLNQEVAMGMLEEVGLVVDLAENGQQALALSRKRRYALILMDVQMPVMSGIDATRAIRAESLNSDTPIVAMTASAYEEDRKMCLDAGMSDHVGKPVTPNLFYSMLLKWLTQRPLSS